jgi:hypothetical protein
VFFLHLPADFLGNSYHYYYTITLSWRYRQNILQIYCTETNTKQTAFYTVLLTGLMPYNFLCVEAGSLLSELTSADSIFTAATLAKMIAAAAATLIPGLLLKSHNRANNVSVSVGNGAAN